MKRLRIVSVAGIGLLAIFLLIAALGHSFGWIQASPFVVGMLVAGTIVGLVGLSHSLRVSQSGHKRLIFIIVCIAIGLRGVALFTSPILEIDYYRYLWDGKVLCEGVSPYAYSPSQVLRADGANPSEDYQRVVALSLKSESNHQILHRIHFANHTTIYPPVSQLVFAAAMKFFPADASVAAHVVFMKFVLVVFDLLTIGLVLNLLACCGFSPGWAIAYAWNPLVIKEVANSGHLDSIAVFFVVASVWIATEWLRQTEQSRKRWPPWACGISLALGFGAKLFPIILLPMLAVVFAKARWHWAIGFLIAFAIPAAGIGWTMGQTLADRHDSQLYFAEHDQDSEEGLSGFLMRWRMNDVVFSTIYRNLHPDSKSTKEPWFVFTTNKQRVAIDGRFRQLSVGGSKPAFFIARLATMFVFAVFYVWILVDTYRSEESFPLRNVVWTLTVFLFLQPTVNPWYWLWVAPLTCFARHKGWLLISALLLVYYLRFWFQHSPQFNSIAESYQIAEPYKGVGLFDHGVAWLEFVAILVVIGWIRFRRQNTDVAYVGIGSEHDLRVNTKVS